MADIFIAIAQLGFTYRHVDGSLWGLAITTYPKLLCSTEDHTALSRTTLTPALALGLLTLLATCD